MTILADTRPARIQESWQRGCWQRAFEGVRQLEAGLDAGADVAFIESP